MSKSKCENCWEFHGCSEEHREGCAAFQNDMGKECWFVSSFTKREDESLEFNKCFECEWFKKFNQN